MKLLMSRNIILVLFGFIVFNSNAFAQSNRSTLNDGVDKYDERKYSDAEIDFRKVVENEPKSFEANFNLGTSYYKQEKYDDAIKYFTTALKDSKSDQNRAKVYHNIGNSLLKSNKLEQSIEAYKNALKFNPNDEDTKYNLSYALELLKNKEQDKNQQNKNDKNKNNNKKDQQKNQDHQNKDQNKDQNKQDQQKNPKPQDQESKQDNTKQSQQQKRQKISKEEANRILEALKNNEKDLQKLLRKKSGKVKKTDKDW